MDLEFASGLVKILQGGSRKRGLIKEVTGRQVAWVVRDHFKISDTDGTVLNLSDPLKVEVKNDNVQSFETQ